MTKYLQVFHNKTIVSKKVIFIFIALSTHLPHTSHDKPKTELTHYLRFQGEITQSIAETFSRDMSLSDYRL